MHEHRPANMVDDEKAMRARQAKLQDRGEPSTGTSGAMTFVRLIALAVLTFFCFAMGTIPASERNGIAELFGPLFFAAAPALYFLPTIEGALRKQPNQMSIAILNIFLGWTLVGWVAAMAWACKSQALVPAPITAAVAPVYLANEIDKLASLRERGLLTDAEFAQQKAKLMA